MKPYYSHAGIQIFLGDCREILPTLPKDDSDLVMTDPPYGIDFVYSGGGGCLARSSVFGGVRVVGDDEPFDPSLLLRFYKQAILWGANHYASRLPDSASWFVWDKREGMCENDQADCEMAWSNVGGPARLKRHYWNGMLKASESGERRVHPTQKPVALMQWCLEKAKPAGRMVDPYMGSGTALVAAKIRGLEAIGIEIHEPYAEIAAKRLSQEVFDFSEVK